MENRTFETTIKSHLGPVIINLENIEKRLSNIERKIDSTSWKIPPSFQQDNLILAIDQPEQKKRELNDVIIEEKQNLKKFFSTLQLPENVCKNYLIYLYRKFLF